MSTPNVPLSNLRAVVILIVVAFHSALAYLASQPAGPFAFDAAPYRWIAFPILDQQRWFGFDLFCAWQDVSLMSLMFFLAGLFTPASLSRKGSLAYLSERWWRIGLPFLFAAAVLSPLAYFASYRATAADPSAAAFWQHWTALPMWPAGPAWFLWQLLVLSALAAALYALAPQWVQALGRLAASLAFPLACATCVFSLLAICLRLMRTRHRLLDSLSANAYRIYLLHYVFVVWLQYSLLGVRLAVIEKASIVFIVALALSWAASAGWMRLAPLFSDLAGKLTMADQLR